MFAVLTETVTLNTKCWCWNPVSVTDCSFVWTKLLLFMSNVWLYLFFGFQVLSSHPNYPKIKKDILDKARSSIRVWSLFHSVLFFVVYCVGRWSGLRTHLLHQNLWILRSCPKYTMIKKNVVDKARNCFRMIYVLIPFICFWCVFSVVYYLFVGEVNYIYTVRWRYIGISDLVHVSLQRSCWTIRPFATKLGLLV